MNTAEYDTLLLTEVQKGVSNSIGILRLLTNESFVAACSLKGLKAALTSVSNSGELPLTQSTLLKAIEKRQQKRQEIDALIEQVKNLSALKEIILQHIEAERCAPTDTPAAIMPKEEAAESAPSTEANTYPTAEDKELLAAVQTADGLHIAKLLLNKAFMNHCSATGITRVQQELQLNSPSPALLTLLQQYAATNHL